MNAWPTTKSKLGKFMPAITHDEGNLFLSSEASEEEAYAVAHKAYGKAREAFFKVLRDEGFSP